MATIITREVGGTAKNSPLTNAELDNNFINLNDELEDLSTPATTTSAGLMSASDKIKLDGVETGAQVNTVASVAGKTGAVTLVTADVGGLGTALSAKADNNVTLTDAAGTSTLPATAAASIASRLQVLRDNVKQVFADLSNKQATLISGTNIKTVGGQSLLGAGNVPTGDPLPTATTISRTGGVITSMTETVGGTSRVTTITRSDGVVTQIAVAHNGATRTETLTRTNGQVTGITVTET